MDHRPFILIQRDELTARFADDRPDLYASLTTPEPEHGLVAWVRERAEAFGIAAFIIATLAACWFAFELGRGAL